MSHKRLGKILLAILALAYASPGQSCIAPAAEVVIDQGADRSTVSLCRGQILTVRLPGNPTTGFVWEDLTRGAEALLARQGEPQFTPDSKLLGAGGIYRFAFEATAPGSARLKFVYRRPFASDAAPARTFEVNILVTK